MIAAKVSRTPSPRVATAGNTGRRRAFSARSRVRGLQHVGQVPLVVLQDHRDRGRVELLREQVPLQLAEGLHVLVEAVGGGVGDEDDPVRAAQHHAARRRVDRLARHRRELEAQVDPAEAARLQRQQVAQDRAVLLRVHGDELAPPPAAGAIVEDLEVRGLPADRGPVVGDLDLDDPLLPVELDHVGLRALRHGAVRTGAEPRNCSRIRPTFAPTPAALLEFPSLRRAASSAGRAPGSQSGGRGFEPRAVHQLAASQAMQRALRAPRDGPGPDADCPQARVEALGLSAHPHAGRHPRNERPSKRSWPAAASAACRVDWSSAERFAQRVWRRRCRCRPG